MNAFENLSRRHLLKVVSIAVAVGGLSVSGQAMADPADQALFFGWPGYEDPGLHADYIAKHGEPPRFTTWGDEEEGLTKVISGFNPDVIFPCYSKVPKWVETGRLAEIDTSKLSNFDDLIPSLRDIDGAVVDGKRVWIPIDWGQTSVAFRTDLAPEYVDNETWEILWDPKYRGRVAVFDSLIDGVVAGGIVEGIDPFDYTSDANLEKVRERTRALTQNVLYYSNDPTTIEHGLASGELVAATVWPESIGRLEKKGLPVKFMNPKEGAMTWVCGLSIIDGGEHLDKAHDLIDSMLAKSSREWEIRNFGYGASTVSAFEDFSAEELEALGLSKNPDDILSGGVFQQPIKGEARLQEMFDEVKAGL